jgi:hypothetical protein
MLTALALWLNAFFFVLYAWSAWTGVIDPASVPDLGGWLSLGLGAGVGLAAAGVGIWQRRHWGLAVLTVLALGWLAYLGLQDDNALITVIRTVIVLGYLAYLWWASRRW